MFKIISLLFVLSLSSLSHSFLLVSPDYRLANHKDVVVNIGQGACRANGIPDESLRNFIDTAINDYWNRVTESELRLRIGIEVDRTTSVPGEILVHCATLQPGQAGVANPYNGGAEVRMSAGFFSTSNYWLPEQFLTTLVHEMGHAIGLNHSGDNASVMTYEENNYLAPKYLSQDDKDGVAYLYPRKGQLDGFIPGCSAKASIQIQSTRVSVWAVLSEIFFFMMALLFLKAMRKFRITQ